METTKSIVIGATPAELYRTCMDLETLPDVLRSVRSVKRTGDKTSHWTVEGPGGKTLEWDTEWTRLEPGKRIAWSSADDGAKTSGQVTFTPMPHDQTELTLMLKIVSDPVEKSPGETEELLEQNLRALKTALEKRD